MNTQSLIHKIRHTWFYLRKPLPVITQFMIAVLGFTLFFTAYAKGVHLQWDFVIYYLAAYTLPTGADIYDKEVLLRVSDTVNDLDYGGLPYLYFPIFARILFPFSYLSYFNAAFLWIILKCIALEITIFGTLFLLQTAPTLLNTIILHWAALFFAPFGVDMYTGNIGIMESTLAICFFAAWKKRKEWSAAIFLICSSVTKGLPLMLALYPYYLREWSFLKKIGVALGVFGSFFVIDYSTTKMWLTFYQSTKWLLFWDELVQGYYNCAYTSALLRIFSETYFTQPLIDIPGLAAIVVPLFPMTIVLMTAFAIHHKRQRGEQELVDAPIAALMMTGLVLISPRMAEYSLSWSFFPLCTVFYFVYREKKIMPLILTIAGIVLFQMYVLPEHVKPGWQQLLIDKIFYGQILLYLSIWFFCVAKPPENNR